MNISVNDFDEIVLNNPFLKEENVGYGIEKLFCTYYICYNPEGLKFNGQSNSTCKYIILKSYFSKKTIKVIREDNSIVIKEFSKENNNAETIEDENKLFKIRKKLIGLNKIVKKQIQDYNNSIFNITKLKFNIASVEEFTNLLYPKLSKNELEKLIKEIKNAEENPLSYTENLTNILRENSTTLSQKILFNIITDELEKIKKIVIVDWKSPFEEVKELFAEQFKKLKISITTEIDKPKKYETTNYIGKINILVKTTEFKMIILGSLSDTYLITFTKKEILNELKKKAEILKIELNEWN